MRAITPTLLAAATSRRGRPVVRCAIEDRRSRWARHVSGSPSTRRTDLAAVSGGVLLRVLLIGAEVRAARIAAPEAPASWPGAWSAIATDADGAEDVALGVYGAGAASAFYLNAAGRLARVDTLDGGATWSPPEECRAWDYTPVRIAASGAVCAISRPGEIRLATTRNDLGGPGWSAEVAYTGAGAFTRCDGLALARDPDDGDLYYFAACVDGALVVTTYDEPSRTFGPTHQVAPAGTVGAAAASQLCDPSLCATPDGLFLSYVDRLGVGDTARWEHPAVLHARHYPHFARVATLAMGQPSAARAALAVAGGALYAAYERAVCRSALWGSDPAAQAIPALPVAGYRRRADGGGSRIEVTVRNAGETFARPGETGGGLAALRPGASLTLSRGYRTAAGDETAALAPHTVVSARLTAGAGGGDLVIEAVDGLGLLARYHPPDTCTWRGASVRALLAEIAGWVGLDYADGGEPALGRTVEAFTLRPADSAAAGVAALLGLVGAVARCDGDGALCARVLDGYTPGPAEIGAGGEVLRGAFGVALPDATGWRVYGEGLGAASAPGEAAMGLGLTFLRETVDRRATSAALAQDLADHLAGAAAREAAGERVAVPLRPDLEVWDRVTVHCPPYASPEDGQRRVLAIEETFDPTRSRYETALVLGREG